jgi:hypothetical protein
LPFKASPGKKFTNVISTSSLAWKHASVISIAQEAEIARTVVLGQPGQKHSQGPIWTEKAGHGGACHYSYVRKHIQDHGAGLPRHKSGPYLKNN